MEGFSLNVNGITPPQPQPVTELTCEGCKALARRVAELLALLEKATGQ
jgi:hypothetical protein